MAMENYIPYQRVERCHHGYHSSDHDDGWSEVEGSAVDPVLTPPTGRKK